MGKYTAITNEKGIATFEGVIPDLYDISTSCEITAEEYEEMTADRKDLVREIQRRILSIKEAVRNMTEARKVANHLGSQVEKAFSYEEKVRPYLEEIREHIDSLELEIDDEIWPLPKYRELLFTK